MQRPDSSSIPRKFSQPSDANVSTSARSKKMQGLSLPYSDRHCIERFIRIKLLPVNRNHDFRTVSCPGHQFHAIAKLVNRETSDALLSKWKAMKLFGASVLLARVLPLRQAVASPRAEPNRLNCLQIHAVTIVFNRYARLFIAKVNIGKSNFALRSVGIVRV